jgi:quercetin dioxygenase-like cupin family protein
VSSPTNRRHALELLAASREGCTAEALQTAHFSAYAFLEEYRRVVMACRAVTVLGAILLASATWAHAQQPGIQRKSLLQQDGPPGYQTIINVLEFAPGAREVRHTHPGPLSGYVLEGTLTLEHEGRPTTAYKAGEAFYVDAGKIHVGINDSTAPLKFLATLVVEKGKPAVTPVP